MMTVHPKKAKIYSGLAGRPIIRVMLGHNKTVISMQRSKFKPHTTRVMKMEVVSPTLVTLTETNMQVTCRENKKRAHHLVKTSGMLNDAIILLQESRCTTSGEDYFA